MFYFCTMKNKNNAGASFSVSQIAVFVICVSMMLLATNVSGQTKYRAADKDIVGVWVLKLVAFDNEGQVTPALSIARVKIYRSNGEYACAEIVRPINGDLRIAPHEYGTYSYKGGVYTEMGRKGSLTFTNHDTFINRWKTSSETWRRLKNPPAKMINHIVEACRVQKIPHDIKQMINKNLFGK